MSTMTQTSSASTSTWLNKVPEVTIIFWIIKIFSTTVGETAADYLAVDVGWGLGHTAIVIGLALTASLVNQLRTTRYTPWAYWLTVVLVSIVGTQITDLLTDDLGVSLYVSSSVFAVSLAVIFAIWYAVEGTLSIHDITSGRREIFYWAAILCTFALGTAVGDLVTEAFSLGFSLGVLSFGTLIAVCYFAWRRGGNAILTFWLAYILTRPFGASLGDLLTQNNADGGLGMGTMSVSGLFFCVIILLVIYEHMTIKNKNEK